MPWGGGVQIISEWVHPPPPPPRKSMPENTNFKNQSINQSINQTLFTHGTISQRQKLKYLQDVIFQ